MAPTGADRGELVMPVGVDHGEHGTEFGGETSGDESPGAGSDGVGLLRLRLAAARTMRASTFWWRYGAGGSTRAVASGRMHG